MVVQIEAALNGKLVTGLSPPGKKKTLTNKAPRIFFFLSNEDP